MNNEKIIATVKLNRGSVGFYDDLSRLHLTLGNPEAKVLSGTNCAALRRAVKAGTISIVSGSLGQDVPPFKIVNKDGRMLLAANTEAEMKPVYAEELEAALNRQAEETLGGTDAAETPEEDSEKTAEQAADEALPEEASPAMEAGKKKSRKKTRKAE